MINLWNGQKYCLLDKPFYKQIKRGDNILYNPIFTTTIIGPSHLKACFEFGFSHSYFCQYELNFDSDIEYRKIIFVTDDCEKLKILL